MENSNKPEKIEFKITEIRAIKFQIDNRQDAIRDVKTEGYKFEIKVSAFFQKEQKLVGFDIELNISTNDDKKIPVGFLLQRTSFSIKQFDSAVKIDNNQINMDSQLMKHFLSVCSA
jgi:hypothetical protein